MEIYTLDPGAFCSTFEASTMPEMTYHTYDHLGNTRVSYQWGAYISRRFILFIFFIITSFNCLAQSLTIELSVNWRVDTIHFDIPPLKSDNIVDVPFLKFTFRNHKEENVYFKKPFRPQALFPPVVFASLIKTSMDLADQVRLQNKEQCNKAAVVHIEEGWTVFSEETHNDYLNGVEYEIDGINDNLHSIHSVLSTQEMLNELHLNKQLFCFRYPEKEYISYRRACQLIYKEKERLGLKSRELIEYILSDDLILKDQVVNDYREEFIFLKAGEVYEIEVSLIAFYIIGGNYEFVFPVNTLKSFIMSHRLVRKDGKIEPSKTLELPRLVEDYTLFTGDFLTNTLKLEFK